MCMEFKQYVRRGLEERFSGFDYLESGAVRGFDSAQQKNGNSNDKTIHSVHSCRSCWLGRS